MTLVEQIYERVRDLPDDAALEVLDFIGCIRLKLERLQDDATADKLLAKGSLPAKTWHAKEFLDRFAGAIPDFPDIEDEGQLQERDWVE